MESNTQPIITAKQFKNIGKEEDTDSMSSVELTPPISPEYIPYDPSVINPFIRPEPPVYDPVLFWESMTPKQKYYLKMVGFGVLNAAAVSIAAYYGKQAISAGASTLYALYSGYTSPKTILSDSTDEEPDDDDQDHS
jgi:hypothetical protein